jgi:hypothetical protein
VPLAVRLAPIAAAGLAAAIIIVRGAMALPSSSDVNLVSGVWLAHAVDLDSGVFYRPLSDAGYYGGTRYFPLLFLLIAAGMRAGLSPVAAGQLAGVAGGLVLVTGACALLMRLRVERSLAVAGAVLAAAPYFVLQGIFAIRAEPLAAGLACWGASFVAGRRPDSADRGWAFAAAACFTLAAITKPTALYAPAAAVLALTWAGRAREAVRLALASGAGWIFALGVIGLASGGRALDAFLTGALAGGTAGSTLRSVLGLDALRLAATSNYLMATMAAVVVVTVLTPGRLLTLPGLFMLLAAVASAVALATPGTILTNQGIEPYVAAAVYLTWAGRGVARLRVAGALAVAVLLLWASGQNVRDLMRRDARDTSLDAARVIDGCGRPVLSESPLLPVLAGRRPVLLDPFAFRVAALNRPGLADDLVTRLRNREFGCVVLEMDPESDRGRGWYANVHLGTPVIDALLEHYAYRGSVAGRRFYVAADRERP